MEYPRSSDGTVTGAHGAAKAKKGDRLGSISQKAQGLRPTSAFLTWPAIDIDLNSLNMFFFKEYHMK